VNLHYRVPRAPRGTTVDIYCGTQGHGGGGILVDHGLPPSAHVPWTFAGLASGRYYFYAVVNRNGVPMSIHYWPRPVDVVDPHAPPAPAGVSATGDSGQLLVSWQEVPGAASYAVTVTPATGGPAIQDAAPADQLGAAIDVPPGRWSVAVSTVDSQGTPSPPRSAKAVTVP
jgi:hypothetical protein